jgi:hypothetical protein
MADRPIGSSRLLQQNLPEADINRNCKIAADWPPGIGPHRNQPPFIMS